MNITYLGPCWEGSTSTQRMKSLERLGHSIKLIDSEPYIKSNYFFSFVSRFFKKIGLPLDLFNINRKLTEQLKDHNSDILWIDKSLIITESTLCNIKQRYPLIKVIGYSPDDMLNPNNQSIYFKQSIRLYDFYLTTKSFNVEELKRLGANKPIFLNNGYDPFIHKKISLTTNQKKEYGGGVGFIGEWEFERFDYIKSLCNQGISVRWWGSKKKVRNIASIRNLRYESRYLWGEAYACAINSFDINLCFLRKVNRDLQTTRSIEIPGCGGFMLAERTDEHLALFKEGFEAEFFSSKEELFDKVNYYLRNPKIRQDIAYRGMLRCINSGYSNDSLLEKFFENYLN